MPRRARCSSRRGWLLVEAVLSAVVIAVGLIFISRGLANQLKALRTVDEYETLLALAHGKLGELEAQRLAGIPPTQGLPEGSFEMAEADSPASEYQWTVAAVRHEDLDVDEEGRPIFSDITLTVRHGSDERRSLAVSLFAIWPSAWVPAEWLDDD